MTGWWVSGRQGCEPPEDLSRRDGGRRLAVKVLPHLALYSRLNAWGCRRDVPEAPKETFHQWYARTRGRDGAATAAASKGPGRPTMSAREDILNAVRDRVPVVPPLPLVPDFTGGTGDLVALLSAALERLDGTVVTATPSGIQSWLQSWLATAFPDARSICSATGEVAGNVDPWGFTHWAAPADVDVTVVRTPMGVAETGSILLTETELAVTTAAVLARHLVVLLDPADIVENIHVAYGTPPSSTPRKRCCCRAIGVRRHRWRHGAPRAGVTTLTAVLAPRIAGCAPE